MMRRPTIPPDQEILYRLPEVSAISGRGRASIYKDVAEGTFPRPIQLGAQSVAWKKSDVDRWIASRPPAAISPPARVVDAALDRRAKRRR